TPNSAESSADAMRDESMAANVRWLHALSKRPRVILWAENAHVSRESYTGIQPMGAHLAKWFGAAYLPIGLLFQQGKFRAVNAHGFSARRTQRTQQHCRPVDTPRRVSPIRISRHRRWLTRQRRNSEDQPLR